MYLMQDAALPNNLDRSSKFAAIAGYIGGNAFHQWHDRDFWSIDHPTRRLPIWVGAGRNTAMNDAHATLNILHGLICHPGRVVALDMETSTDANYVATFGRIVRNAGYYVWVYGSPDFIIHLPILDGRWVADVPKDAAAGQPHDSSIEGTVATQYAWLEKIDESKLRFEKDLRLLW